MSFEETPEYHAAVETPSPYEDREGHVVEAKARFNVFGSAEVYEPRDRGDGHGEADGSGEDGRSMNPGGVWGGGGDSSSEFESPRERARRAMRKRKMKNATRQKIFGMAKKLYGVLVACSLVVGGVANDVVVEPLKDVAAVLSSTHGEYQDRGDRPRSAGLREERADLLEIFAGSANMSAAFADARKAVLRPRDLVYGDDFKDPGCREAILQEVDRYRPRLVWCAPPCTHWCAWSRMNYGKEERKKLRRKDKDFLDFIDELFVRQRQHGGHVIVENPKGSDIWDAPVLRRWAGDPSVAFFSADMCSYNMRTLDGEDLMKKGMGFLCTSRKFGEVLETQCTRDHIHRQIQGKETGPSGRYPEQFCVEVVKALDVVCAQPGGGTEEVFVNEAGTGDQDSASRGRLGAASISFKGTISGRASAALKRLHQNLGHPSQRELVRHLRLSGAPDELVRGASQLECTVCRSNARPRSHHVAKPAVMLDFNECVAMDIIFMLTSDGIEHMGLNVVDLASGYQVVSYLPDRKADTVSSTFLQHWVNWAGVPERIVLDLDTAFQDSFWKITSDHAIAMKAAAGQAHWQNGVAERSGSSWKEVWNKLVDAESVTAEDVVDAMAAVNHARNTLRSRSGYSPRQWVFGCQPREVPNLEDGPTGDLSAASALTADRKMGRLHALRLGAKVAHFQVQSADAVSRAIRHRNRVTTEKFEPGDLVYAFREAKGRGNKWASKWLGPAVVIGAEGSNYWVARGGRCLLVAGEHVRPAEHEEVSQLLRMKAAMQETQQVLDREFGEYVDETAGGRGVGGDDLADMEFEDLGGEEMDELVAGMPTDVATSRDDARKAAAVEVQQRIQEAVRRKRALDDVPTSVRRTLQKGAAKEVHMAKHGLTGDALEKALDKELPWHMIPDDERDKYREAEVKQWNEHLEFRAVRPLSLEESRQVEATVDPSRLLPSRFLYRDKNRAKRRTDPSVGCKAKARLCVGGQLDPDLGVVDMAVDAPTTSRLALLLGLQVALARGWKIGVGDIRCAFLNGVEAPRNLFFKQPKRGLPGLEPGQLVSIEKGIFGLSTSPKLWWLKFSGDIIQMVIHHADREYVFEQNEVDPCAFRLVDGQSREVVGLMFTHVDDVMLMTRPELTEVVRKGLVSLFPIEEWEEDKFEYVGCEYTVSAEEVVITLSSYARGRVEKVKIPEGLAEDMLVPEESLASHRSTVGGLSWLAKQTRPDLQFSVSQAQKVQKKPTIKDLKETNWVVEQAKRHHEEGIRIRKIPEENLMILGYHDAAWANVDLDGVQDPEAPLWDGSFKLASQLGSLILIADRECLGNVERNMSLIEWRSKSSSRVCRSTFAGETMACAETLESCLYARTMLISFLDGQFMDVQAAGLEHSNIHK